jgi:hypothetical protein
MDWCKDVCNGVAKATLVTANAYSGIGDYKELMDPAQPRRETWLRLAKSL